MRTLLALALLLPTLALGQTPSDAGARDPDAPSPGGPIRQRPPRGSRAPVRAPQSPPSAEPPGSGAPAIAPAPGTTPAPAAPAAIAPAPGATPTPAAPGAAPAGGTAGGTARVVQEDGPGPGTRGGSCQPMQGRFLLAFNKAEIVDVLEQASRWTCRNFAYTEEVARGKITLLSKTPVTAEEAYNAFLAALTANNIAVYQSGRYWKLVRIADAKKTPIPTLLDDAGVPAQEQPVTKMVRLRYADVDQLRGILGNFTSTQGADVQSVPPDLLIITDIGLNVRRLEKIIEAVDRPGSGDLVRFIQVKYASARDLAEKVNQIFQQAPAAPGRPAGRRSAIGGVAAPVAPGAAPAPAVAGGAGVEGGESSIQKVLADERTNKLVVIADEKGYERIRDLVAQLDLPTAGEGQIHVVFMKNSSAEDLAQTLSALAQGQATSRRAATGGTAPAPAFPQQPVAPVPAAAGAAGATSAALFAGEVKVTADKQSNALIILASGPDYATMQRLIENLDRPRRQVFVEAVIMEVNLRNERQFGVSAHAAAPFKTSDGTGFIPVASETGRVNSFAPLDLLQLGGFLTGLVGPVSGELRDVFGVSSVSVLLQALQTSSDVNVLSTPHVLASDNEESEITVGQNVPFQAGFSPNLGSLSTALSGTTGSTTTPTSAANLLGLGGLGGLGSLYAPIQRQNVELRLRIKPQINEGDMISLQLDEQTEEIASQDPQLGPTTSKRSVKTKIIAKDQNTIVIGGLIQDRAVRSVHKVPLLGDIPVFGWLFRDEVTTKQKTNLLLFLTPYIIRDPSDYRRILERKRKEQDEVAAQFYGRSSQYQVHVDYARKAGPYSKMRRDIELESARLENGGTGLPGERTIVPERNRPQPPSQRPAPGDVPGGPRVEPPAAPPAAPPPSATPSEGVPHATPGGTPAEPAPASSPAPAEPPPAAAEPAPGPAPTATPAR